MPELTIHVEEADQALLERVRLQQGLDTVDQAAEWLLKKSIRKIARQANGRGRALYAIDKGPRS